MPTDRPPLDSPLVELLRYKWTIRIVHALDAEAHRFNELQRAVGGAPNSVLSERLKQLEAESVVVRTVADTSPPQVSYRLTERGEALARVVSEIGRL